MISTLVLSPDPSVPGGVTVFVECLRRHVRDSRVQFFTVGSSGRGDEAVGAVIWRFVSAPGRLMRRVGAEKFDVVHINPSFDIKALIRDGLFILVLRAIGFRRILFYIHGWDVGLQRRILGNALWRGVTGWVLNKAALITVLGNNFRDALVAMGVEPGRIVVTRMMYETDATPDSDATPAARPYILFLSRFDREKGGRELIRAFAALAQDYPTLDLVMAGDGEEAEFLRRLASSLNVQNRILFPGYVGGTEKTRLLRHCAIFALPTYYSREGMPVAVVEAMGAGKPVLVGAAGALRSIIAQPDNGVILDHITDATIAVGLRLLLDNPVLADTAGKRNADIAATRFAADAVTAEIETLYQRVASC